MTADRPSASASRFEQRDVLRIHLARVAEAVVRIEAVVGISENEVAFGEVDFYALEPIAPPAFALFDGNLGYVERLSGEHSRFQKTGPLYRTDGSRSVLDEPSHSVKHHGIEMSPLLRLLEISRVAAIVCLGGIGVGTQVPRNA